MKTISTILIKFSLVSILISTSYASSGTALSGNSAVPAVASANLPYTGFFIGAQAGLAQTNTDFTCIDIATGAVSYDRFSTSGVVGGLHLGYGYQLENCWYFGIELAGNLYSNKDKLDGGNGVDVFKKRVRHSFALNPRVGYVFNGCGLAYIKLGFELTQWNHAIDHNGIPVYYSKTKYEPGFAPGIGVSYFITPNVNIGIEGSYVFYSKAPKVRNLAGENHKYRDRTTDFKIRLSYKL